MVAFDRTFHYNKLNDAMIALKNGARYFATNPDRTCPVDGSEIPDCAGMMGAIEGEPKATGNDLRQTFAPDAVGCLGTAAAAH